MSWDPEDKRLLWRILAALCIAVSIAGMLSIVSGIARDTEEEKQAKEKRQSEQREEEAKQTAREKADAEWDRAIKDGYVLYVNGIEVDPANIDHNQYNASYNHDDKKIYLAAGG